jgi:glycosyltransferase involved in cell wall biosynthesis
VKIRVVEVLASLRRAGAERLAVSLACGLDPDRFETRVVSLFDAFPEGFEPVLSERRVPVDHLGKRRGMDLRMYPRLMRVFRRFRPDIIHTHSYVLRYTFPASVAIRTGCMVHTVHNVALRETEWLGRMIHRVAFRRGVVPVAVAAEVARSFQKVYGFAPVATIPNGIDVDRFLQPDAGREWRRAHGFSAEDRLAVSVARLEPQKNPLGLVDAFARALPDNARWHLLLVGDGNLREEVCGHIARLRLGHRVHLLGIRADVVDLLSAADVFVLASHWEGNPMAVMEAMAAGLPVVATAAGGVPEVVEHGVTGLLAPPGDTEALASALAELARDPQRRDEFRQAALRRVLRFSLSAMIASYSELFVSLAGGRS